MRNLRSYTRLIGFEPDAEESARINALPAETHGLREMRILPIALARESGTVTINVCNNRYASSLLVPNSGPTAALKIMGVDTVEDLEVVDTFSCEASTLDQIVREQDLATVDYVKLDTQGSELDILEGGASTFSEKVLFAKIEVEFIEMYQDQPLFGDVDRRMQELGFVLLGIDPLTAGWPKSGTGEGRGQLIFSEALYVRDVLGLQAGFLEQLNLASRIRLILMLESEGFSEHAVEVASRSLSLDPELFGSLVSAIPQRNRKRWTRYPRKLRYWLASRLYASAMFLYGRFPTPLRSLYIKSSAKRLFRAWLNRRRLDEIDKPVR